VRARGARGRGSDVRPLRPRVRWSFATAVSQVALAVGFGCSVSQWGVTATLLIGCLFAAAGVAIAQALWGAEGRGLRAVLTCGMSVGFATTSVIGAVAVLGALGCLFLVPFVWTQPLVAGVWQSFWRDRFGPPVLAGVTRESAPDACLPLITVSVEPERFDVLDDAALCRAWRRSFVRMESAATADVWLGIVEQRARCLDELERRSPQAFAAWLASGARAASDPLPFLQNPRGRGRPGC